MAMKRRQYLKGTSIVALAGAAGCVGTEGNNTSTPTDGSGGTTGSTNTQTESAPDNVVFGGLAHFEGTFAPYWPANHQAIMTAIDEVNAAGGPKGATLKLEERDTAGSVQQARQVIPQLVNNDNAQMLLGGTSNTIPALFERFAEAQTPLINPWAGTTFLNDKPADNGTPNDVSDDGWVWRTTASDTLPAVGAAVHLSEGGMNRVGLMHVDTPGARSWVEGFEDSFEKVGGEITNTVPFAPDKSSYQSELSRLFEADFDAWVLAPGGTGQAVPVVEQWLSAGYGKQLVMSNSSRTSDFASAIGSEGDGILGCGATLRGPNYETFVEKYKEQGDEELNAFATGFYDAVNLGALALHAADEFSGVGIEKNLGPVGRKNEGDTVVTTFAEGKEALDNGESINYEGASTPCDFDKFGEVVTDIGVFEMQGGGWTQVKTLESGELQEAA